MRAWSVLFCSALLSAVLALPSPAAAASQVSHPSSFFPLTNGVIFPSMIFGSRFGRFTPATQKGFFSPISGWASPLLGCSLPPYQATPQIIVLNAAAAQAAAPVDRPKVSVERTPNGVQVVRGPGSHHLAHF